MRKLVLLSVLAGSLLAAPAAKAAIPNALGITCNLAADNVRECGSAAPRSTAPSWDGTPIDVNIAFPPAPGSGTDGNYPLIIVGHGYGGSKIGFGASGSTSGLRRFTSRGYAVFSMTDRGFHESCGTPAAITAALGACNGAGWIHLMDDRFEVRDAQFFAGELADEGLVDGQRIGAIGGSYGGGLSLQLATLNNRVMMPDGSLVPWTSPVGHVPMRIAAATPDIPWSDLAYSLNPNGAKLDYVADAPYTGRAGVEKLSFQTGLYLSGQVSGEYCGQAPYPACTDFQSDVTQWKNRIEQGEPYDGDPLIAAILSEIKSHHSAYYIDHSTPPAPLLISNGFTDDLFPADEALAYYNRIRAQYPDAPISMLFGDFGHMRALNKPGDSNARDAAQNAWLDFYVKGSGGQPFQGVTTFAITCPSSAPSGGPFQAGSWAGLQHGVVRFRGGGVKTVSASGGSPDVDTTFDPVSGGGACATAPATDLPGVATYRLPAAGGGGYTLMGSAMVLATISSPAANSELAARLLDVAPDGSETLVTRQLYRPEVGTSRQVFQLHPSGHLFAAGHVAKLELLPRDAGGTSLNSYGRPANGQGDITISHLDLRLPVLEGRGAAALVVASPALPLPCGKGIAQQYSSADYVRATLGSGKLRRSRRSVKVPVDSAPSGEACKVQVRLIGKKRKKGRRPKILGNGTATIPAGKSGTVKVRLTKKGRRALKRKARVQVITIDPTGNTVQNAKAGVVRKRKKH
jgi:dienelactone hydrolase